MHSDPAEAPQPTNTSPPSQSRRPKRRSKRSSRLQRARRAWHGALCLACDSVHVVIEHTRTTIRDADATGRILQRDQDLQCLTCGHRWGRRLEIEEIVVEGSEHPHPQ